HLGSLLADTCFRYTLTQRRSTFEMTGTLTKTVLDTSRQTEPYPMNGQGNGLCSTTASHIIEFDAVTKKFDEHVVLDQLSFNVQHGDKVTIIGQSESGKSTVLRILMTLEDTQDEHIFVVD